MIYLDLTGSTNHVLGCRFDDGDTAIASPGESSRIERNRFESVTDAIVNPSGTRGIIRGNYVDANDHFMFNDTDNMFGWIIEGNHVNEGDIEHSMGGGGPTSRQVVFANNYLSNGVYDLRRIIGLTIADNTFLGGPGGEPSFLHVWECQGATLTGNYFLEVAEDEVVWVHDSQDVMVSDNAFAGNTGIQIHIEFETTEWQYAAVEGNLIGPGQASVGNHLIVIVAPHCIIKGNLLDAAYHSSDDDTYDAIQVNSDNCLVEGNKIITDSGGGLPRYGINITGDDNIVVGNDLRGSYGTDPLNDAGTGTILTYPNDVTYGDNFT